MKRTKASNAPLVAAAATAVFFLGAAYYAISAGKEVISAIEDIAIESPQVYITPESRDIPMGADQMLISSPAIVFSDILFRVPWQDEAVETKGLRGVTLAYQGGRSITVIHEGDPSPRTAIQSVFGEGAQPVMERFASAYGPDILDDPFRFTKLVLDGSPENITFLTLQSRAETERLLLVMKQNASILNEKVYVFETRHVRGFQFGTEADVIIAIDVYKRDGSAYSFLLKGISQADIDLILASIR